MRRTNKKKLTIKQIQVLSIIKIKGKMERKKSKCAYIAHIIRFILFKAEPKPWSKSMHRFTTTNEKESVKLSKTIKHTAAIKKTHRKYKLLYEIRERRTEKDTKIVCKNGPAK